MFILWKTTITVWSLAAPPWYHSGFRWVSLQRPKEFSDEGQGVAYTLLGTTSFGLMHLVLSFDEQDLLFPKPFPANLELYWIILDSGPTGISRKKRFSSWEALPVTFLIFLEVSKTHPVSKGRLCMVLYRELLSCASLMLTSIGHNYKV